MNKIFQNLIVVELASVLAGPAVGMFFAELGAKVMKIENKKTAGDVTRQWKIRGEKTDGPAAYYYSINYGKESHFLDLSDEQDYEKAIDFIKHADIVISNFNESIAHKLKVSYNHLKAINETIIFAQLNSFAQDKTRPAYDVVMQAETGFLSMMGIDSDQLVKMPVALIDVLAAHQLKEGVLVALIQRMQTGQGCQISTSLEESALASLVNQATNYLMVDYIPKPMGTKHPNIAPYGDVFTTSDDKKIVLAVGTDTQFNKLCLILNIPQTNAFLHNEDRVKNRIALIHTLQEKIKDIALSELMNLLNENKVPIGHIKNLQEVFQTATAQNMTLSEKHDRHVSKRIKSVAFKIS